VNKIWAPWRMKYILSDKKEDGCVFCNAYMTKNDEEKLVVYRSEYSFVIMNLYPYNAGHLLVVPNKHIDSPDLLDQNSKLDMFNLVTRSMQVLEEALHPDGFNMGMNIKRVAGAGIEDHMHIHIVPRWNGDTNFIPIIADTKVISEGINDTYQKIKKVFKD